MCSGASLTVLAGLALAAAAWPARAASSSHCDHLALLYNASLSWLGPRIVSRDGQPLDVLLVWGTEPARAAAALLLVLLRDALRYRRLRLQPAPARLADLARSYNQTSLTDDAVVGISAAWEPKAERGRVWKPESGAKPGLAGERLVEFGVSSVPARRRLHARLAPAAPLPACRSSARWAFYTNTTALRFCSFLNMSSSYEDGEREAASAAVVYGTSESRALLDEVQARAAAAGHALRTQLLDRVTLASYIQTAKHSFLFIDYDFWHGEPNVSLAEPPPCISNDSVCLQELDPTVAIRVADLNTLQSYEPQLMQFAYNFNPSPESLRLILEREANGTEIEEAACAWAVEHQRELKTWKLDTYDITTYDVMVYYCYGDPYSDEYDKLIQKVDPYTYTQTKRRNFDIIVKRGYINCSDTYNLSSNIYQLGRYVDMNRLVGVVAAGTAGAAHAAALAARMSLPLLLLDAAPAAGPAAEPVAAWHVLGRPRHLARALQRFVIDSGWTRLAVLSQQTTLAAEHYDEISHGATFALRNYPIPLKPSKLQAEDCLRSLRINARIIFVNADPEAAAVIMTAALELRMSFTEGFVWIFREWPVAAVNTTLLTVSFWARGKQGVPRAHDETERELVEVRRKLRRHWKGRAWPPRADVLADALLTLTAGIYDMLLRYPSTQRDLHSDATMRAFYKSLDSKPIKGINHVLRYKDAVVEESYVFVDQWRGETFVRRLAAWSVNASASSLADAVRGPYRRPALLPRDDGASHCLARAGDAFDPDCYDAVWATALLLLALAPAALFMYRRALQRRITRLLKARETELLERRQHVAAALAAYLVKREALELYEELGAGHFGCVRLALLRLPALASRYVAAKALRENAAPAEESEFLREACTIASLDHEHVVRLVGVCISDGPPLVLMELAFFGDLLGYLRARRHLAEGAECAAQESFASFEEAVHVSAEALTRLAREAAAALAYLGSRGVVHRDVRAANCLVDARRSLKLADFGMARETVAGADGAPEYACRRRGMFPVLWMAPESLAHGVFSAATDVWALGVLVLELVTLGARPYGSMSPLRVLQYVAAGGRPPLPLDATPQTRGLARLCWQREAERRPSAAEVQAYLEARPQALRAALRTERDEPADADSGFGESPSTELLPPDSPLDFIDQLEV